MHGNDNDVIEFGQTLEPNADATISGSSKVTWLTRGLLGVMALTLIGGYAALAARPELSNYFTFLPEMQSQSACSATGPMAFTAGEGSCCSATAEASLTAEYIVAEGSCCPSSRATVLAESSCCSGSAQAQVVALAGPPAPSLPVWIDEAQTDELAQK